MKIYNYYDSYLKTNNKIDFEDMIYYANKSISNINEDKYQYIIIDEYQDISTERYNFISELSKRCNAHVIAVGDDWQTIYSFTGSNIQLFIDFKNKFRDAEYIKLNHTYRNSQNLINIAGRFIMKNDNQIKKELLSDKNTSGPIKKINFTSKSNQFEKLCSLLDLLHDYRKDKKILILTRKNSEIKNLIDGITFIKEYDTQIKYFKYPEMDINIMTTHKAKGLGFDEVIMLNVSNDNYPCKYDDTDWIKDAFKFEKLTEDCEFAEDRRLFYVALTRTKEFVFLLCPEDNTSIFVDEILNDNKII